MPKLPQNCPCYPLDKITQIMYIICVRYSNSPGYDGGATERKKPVTTNSTTKAVMTKIVVATIEAEIKEAARVAVEKVADQPRWARAIAKAEKWLLSRPGVQYHPETHTLAVQGPEYRAIYLANGVCQCQAFKQGNPCYHRAAARLVTRALELAEGATPPAPAPAPVARPSIDDLFND